MKRFVIYLLLVFCCVNTYCREISVCKWTVSAIVVSKQSDGSVEYGVHYQGKRYTISVEQYELLTNGYDITLSV